MEKTVDLERLTNLAKRRGFVYPTAEIYGGLSAIYDFGPLGVLLKNNIRQEWWKRFVQMKTDIVAVDSAVITKREVLQASGHEESFTDPMVECKVCNERFRADQEIPPASDHVHELTEAKRFHLMFKTHVGPTEETGSIAYLRPETAQGMFTNFKTILDTARVKIPFGIAQVGRSFRNEITTGEWLFRLREFEIAEIEYFVKPGEDEKWFDAWLKEWEKFFLDLGLSKENLKRHEHPKDTLAHYSKRTVDLRFHFSQGWKELAGVANRTDYDLKNHQEKSGKDLRYFDEKDGTKYLPYVIEPTMGLERAMFAFLADAYKEYKGGRGEKKGSSPKASEDKESEGGVETVLHLHPRLTPIKAAVFPLVNKEKLPNIAQDIVKELKEHYFVQYDDSGSIGRRYRRQDEIGTPFCVTVDFESQKKKTVTVRDRDSMKQERVAISELRGYFVEKLA